MCFLPAPPCYECDDDEYTYLALNLVQCNTCKARYKNGEWYESPQMYTIPDEPAFGTGVTLQNALYDASDKFVKYLEDNFDDQGNDTNGNYRPMVVESAEIEVEYDNGVYRVQINYTGLNNAIPKHVYPWPLLPHEHDWTKEK